LDDCRFDIKVNDCVWYLRAKTVEERQVWLNILEEQRVFLKNRLKYLIKFNYFFPNRQSLAMGVKQVLEDMDQ
jgi:hypothetical protein